MEDTGRVGKAWTSQKKGDTISHIEVHYYTTQLMKEWKNGRRVEEM